MERILHVVGGIGIGGIQTYLLNLYKNIDKNKVQFDFLVHVKSENNMEKIIKEMGGKIYYIENDYFEKKQFLKYIKFINNFFKEHKEYKIVHGHLRSTSLIYMALAKKHKLHTICHSHSTTNGYGIKGIIKNLAQFPTKFFTDYFMGCSKKANIWMFGKKIANSKRCFVIHNGIDEKQFIYNDEKRKKIRKEFDIKDNTTLIGNVGRLVPEKNQEFLLKIIIELKKTSKRKFKLIIIGDGILKNKLLEMSNKMGLEEDIIFAGSRNDVNLILQGCDIFVLPSKNEGLGIVAIESQAAGLETIVSNAIPKEAYISDLCCCCKSNEAKDWAKLIETKSHKKRRMDMSTKIIESQYSINEIANWLCNFYTNILK